MRLQINNLKIFPGKILRDDFFRHTLIMMAGLQLVNVFNLLYHLVMVRVLTYREYGTLNALTILSFYFCQFTPPFQPALAKYCAGYLSRGRPGAARYLIRRASLDLGAFSLLVIAVFTIWARPLALLQRIAHPDYMILVGILIAVNIMISAPQAFLQAAQLFTSYSVINAVSAFLKLVVGVGLLWLGLRVTAGVWGFITTPLVVVAAGYWVTYRYFHSRRVVVRPEDRIPLAPIYRYYLPTALVLVAFTFLTNADVTLVKKFFNPREAGYYSVAQMVGKIILFLPWAVSIVVFPKAASSQVKNESSLHYLKKGLLVTAGLTGAGTLVCGFFPAAVLRLLTGKADPEAVSLVFLFALAMSLYALLWLVVYYNLSVHSTRFIKYLAAAAVIQTGAIFLYHPTLRVILLIISACAALTLAVTLSVSRTSVKTPQLDREVI